MPVDPSTRSEKRRYPRFGFDRRTLLRLPDGNIIQATAHNISLNGIQIRCDSTRAYLLHSSERDTGRYNRQEIDVRIALPLSEGLVEFGANCQPVYQKVLEQKLSAFGLRFATFENNSVQILNRFVQILSRQRG
jgi:hypothetical protein